MKVLRCSLVCFVFLVLQTSVIGPITIFGSHADLVLLVTIAAGLAAGAESGAIVGFAVGLCIDLLGAGPVGLTALVCTLVGYTVGSLHAGVLRATSLIPIGTAAAASAAGVLLYALLGELLGRSTLQMGDVPTIIGVVAVVNAIGCLPAAKLMRWALTDPVQERISWR